MKGSSLSSCLPFTKEADMGKGTDLARMAGNTAHADLVDNLKDQLIIVLVKRLGSSIDLPVSEVDDTGADLLALSINNGTIHLEIQKKV